MRKQLNKKLIIFLSLSLMIVLGTLGVYAYLQWQSSNKNTFISEVSELPSIKETFDSNKKSNVSINVGNTGYSVYVRCAIVVNWKDSSGHVLGVMPVEGTDYLLDVNEDDWFLGSDGYYYHKNPVLSNADTKILINECEPLLNAPVNNYTLSVEIITQTIQAAGLTDDGNPLVSEAWGVQVNDDDSIF